MKWSKSSYLTWQENEIRNKNKQTKTLLLPNAINTELYKLWLRKWKGLYFLKKKNSNGINYSWSLDWWCLFISNPHGDRGRARRARPPRLAAPRWEVSGSPPPHVFSPRAVDHDGEEGRAWCVKQERLSSSPQILGSWRGPSWGRAAGQIQFLLVFAPWFYRNSVSFGWFVFGGALPLDFEALQLLCLFVLCCFWPLTLKWAKLQPVLTSFPCHAAAAAPPSPAGLGSLLFPIFISKAEPRARPGTILRGGDTGAGTAQTSAPPLGLKQSAWPGAGFRPASATGRHFLCARGAVRRSWPEVGGAAPGWGEVGCGRGVGGGALIQGVGCTPGGGAGARQGSDPPPPREAAQGPAAGVGGCGRAPCPSCRSEGNTTSSSPRLARAGREVPGRGGAEPLPHRCLTCLLALARRAAVVAAPAPWRSAPACSSSAPTRSKQCRRWTWCAWRRWATPSSGSCCLAWCAWPCARPLTRARAGRRTKSSSCGSFPAWRPSTPSSPCCPWISTRWSRTRTRSSSFGNREDTRGLHARVLRGLRLTVARVPFLSWRGFALLLQLVTCSSGSVGWRWRKEGGICLRIYLASSVIPSTWPRDSDAH